MYQLKWFSVGLILSLFLHINGVGSTPDPEPSQAWKLKFASSIRWQQITPLGNLVVNTDDGLYGIDPDKGKVSWEIKKLAGIPFESYQVLPNTFYAQISLDNQVIVLDPYEGKILSDTRKAGFKSVVAKNILYESGAILIYGFKEKFTASLSLFDIASGKELWNNSEVFTKSKGLGGFMSNLSAASDLAEGEDGPAFNLIEVDEQAFIIANANGIFNINTQSGQMNWKADLPRPKGAVSSSNESKLIKAESGPYFYYARSNYLMGYNIKDGMQAWPEIVKINGLVNEIISHPKGLILLPKIDPVNNMFGTRINLVDYQTGKTSWGKKGKGLKIPGSVVNINYIDDDIILVMADGDKSFLNILDVNNDQLKFDNSLKIKGVLEYTEMTKSGLLYITKPDINSLGEINIFDLQNGQPKLAKSIKSGRPADQAQFLSGKFRLLRAFKDNLLYVFSNKAKTLYEVNLDNAKMKILQEKIAFEGKERATHLEVRNDGLLLNSEQNIASIGFDGKIKFQKYYPAPKEPGILRALHTLDAIHAALYSAQAQMVASTFNQAAAQSSNELGREISSEIASAYDQQAQKARAYSSGAMAAAKRRFKASAVTSDFIFMMITLDKQKTGVAKALEGRNYGLVRVSKNTGEIIETINMKDEKEPSYQVDDVQSAIYYRQNPNEIVSYKFNK